MNFNTSTLNDAASTVAAKAEHFVDAAKPRLRDVASSALDTIKPVIAFALPLARRVNWQLVAFGLAAGAAGYLIRSGIGSAAERKARIAGAKPHELNRWENEGGMTATSTPASSPTASQERPADADGAAASDGPRCKVEDRVWGT
ncbi:hypothetical protein [Nevskia ramosa]|uniref:hypothetical protein n=1 Tax=Nevskia ramosa TaxID=64002 RepID=UPI0003B3712E|nr:hypothetical protein [Nevskia ramosa]